MDVPSVCVCLSIDGVLKLTMTATTTTTMSGDQFVYLIFLRAFYFFVRSFSNLIDCIFNFFSYSEIRLFLRFLLFFYYLLRLFILP